MHPFINNISELKDSELEAKIQDISRKYWMTNNPDVKNQMVVILDMYQEELRNRRIQLIQKQYQNRDKDLDKLIKIN